MKEHDISRRTDGASRAVAHGLGVAALATAVIPLLPYSAEATVVTIAATVTMSPAVVSGYNIFDYTVTNTSSNTQPWANIAKIEIPEYHFGDLDFFGYGAYVPADWSAVQNVTSTLTGAMLPGGVTPGGYWLLTANDAYYGLTPGSSLHFIAESVTGATQKADFAFQVYSGQNGIVDPPVPNTFTPAPEPASAAVLGAGLLGLLGLRRRGKA